MERRSYQSGLPPEVRQSLDPEELTSLEHVWLHATGSEGAAPSTNPPWIVERAAEMRTSLRAEGVLPPAEITPIRPPNILRLKRWHGYAAIAASVAILLAVGITVDHSDLDAPYGEQATHTLADGSTLLLNSGTRLRVARNFNRQARIVRLMRGEVRFTVAESDAPFVVRTDDGEVEVLGTVFNVRSWPSDSERATNIAVESGTVRVTLRKGNTIVLQAGDAIRLERNGRTIVALHSSEAEHQLSWARKSFKYADHLTGDLFEELERRYDIDIQVESKGLLDTRSGILLESPSGPEQILRDICELQACTFESDPEGRAFQILSE